MRLLLGTLLSIALASAAPAADFEIVLAADGLARPIYVTAPAGDQDRLFIVEQHTGQILILNLADDSINATPFLTVGGVSIGNEQGLLGLAFPFDYESTGYFYVNYTAGGDTIIARYQVSGDSDVADAGSGATVLRFNQPASNHNGGWIGFAGDDYLYISTGDGGDSNDAGSGHSTGGNAQDITNNLLGKVLRIDVGGDDFPADADRNYAIPPGNPFVGVTGDDEIWAYGLRNPWRISFDRMTGDLWMGDVGQNNCEEIDVQPADSPGGENYGWRLREGMIATPTGGVGGARPPGAIDPVFDYPHSSSTCGDPSPSVTGCSVTGGYVYRGAVPSLKGLYFFGDYCTSELWSLRFDGSDPGNFDGTNFTEFKIWNDDPDFVLPEGTAIDRISSFGEDDDGNLYIIDLRGEVFRIQPAPEPSAFLSALAAVGCVALLRRSKRSTRDSPGPGGSRASRRP